MVRKSILLLLSIISFQTLALTQVTATVDKNPVTLKESLILTVTADDDVDANALNTAPLAKDFIVGRTSVSTQTSMINFKTSRTTKWQTVLIPRREGIIELPSLTVEDKSTAPISLTVLSANDPSASTQRDVFIEADVSDREVYVQQMLTLTVKLYFAAELKRGSLTEPELTGATIAQVGKDLEEEAIINGRRYRVIQRTFSITPHESGDFVLKSPMFSGEIMVQSARRSNFLSFGETKAISVLGDEIPLTVKSMPANYASHWLPSELITLHQEWQPANGEYKVGEPITRTITLTAAGVGEEQLPELSLALPQGLKVYPDQQSAHSTVSNGRFVSQTVNNFAIVASKPGEFTLPAVEVPWWNTVTNRQEVASLPAQTITILPSEIAEPRSYNPEPSPQASESATDSNSAPETIIVEQASWLQWLFLALWLLTAVAWITTEWLRRKKQTGSVKSSTAVSQSHLALIAACKQNNGKEALSLLVPWFNQLMQSSTSNFAQNGGKSSDRNEAKTLHDVKVLSENEALVSAIDELQSYYFSKDSAQSNQQSSWQGQRLLAAITGAARNTKKVESSINLSLNPTQ